MHAIDAVYHLIELPHLLYLLGIDIEQILLDGAIGPNAHDDYSGFLVMVAWAVDALQHVAGGTDNGYRATGGSDKPCFLEVPVLGEVFTKHIGIDEHSYDAGHRLLLAQFLGTAGSIVGHMRP